MWNQFQKMSVKRFVYQLIILCYMYKFVNSYRYLELVMLFFKLCLLYHVPVMLKCSVVQLQGKLVTDTVHIHTCYLYACTMFLIRHSDKSNN